MTAITNMPLDEIVRLIDPALTVKRQKIYICKESLLT